MPVRRATSIVIRSYRVGEADKIVVFFTLERGKLRGIAKGARRTRSRHGGSLEIGNEVELTYFEKEGRELVSVDRCDIVRSRFSELGEPILAATLAYFLDLVDSFAPEHDPNVRLYRLLRASIGSLTRSADAETKARYFESWLLRLVGFYPRRKTCASCGKALAGSDTFYVPEEHRLGCRGCHFRGVPLGAETLEYLGEIWSLAPEDIRPPASDAALRELAVLNYKLIQEQLEKELPSHQILEDMMREEKREKLS